MQNSLGSGIYCREELLSLGARASRPHKTWQGRGDWLHRVGRFTRPLTLEQRLDKYAGGTPALPGGNPWLARCRSLSRALFCRSILPPSHARLRILQKALRLTIKQFTYISLALAFCVPEPVWAEVNTPLDVCLDLSSKTTDRFNACRTIAQEGHPTAQLVLAIMYHNGIGVPKNDPEAIVWIRRAADHGSALAQFALGEVYKRSDAVPVNHAEAVVWYRRAAEQGYAPAQYELGEMYRSSRNLANHLARIQGSNYKGGKGVPTNVSEAVVWYRRAAAQGHASAQYKLSTMILNGKGVPKDEREAVKWVRKAAEQGHIVAQIELGDMYRTGEGVVPQDGSMAVAWYQRAANQTEDKIYSHRAAYQIAEMYHRGEGVIQDFAEAESWWQQLAERGDAWSQYALGVMYDNGERWPMGDAEAVVWYRRSADQGFVRAQYILGVKYDKGEGVTQDYMQAHMWFNLASSKGHEQAREARNFVQSRMTPAQVAEAQRMAREWTLDFDQRKREQSQKFLKEIKEQPQKGGQQRIQKLLMEIEKW